MNFFDKLSPEEQTILEFHSARERPDYATIGPEFLLDSLPATDAAYAELLAAGLVQHAGGSVWWPGFVRPKYVLTEQGLEVCRSLTSHQPILNPLK